MVLPGSPLWLALSEEALELELPDEELELELELLEELLLDGLLLDGLLLDGLLLEELLLDGLPLLDGGVELGTEGGCGVVGLLALGQPLNNRQAQPTPVIFSSAS